MATMRLPRPMLLLPLSGCAAGPMILSLGTLLALACTYRTDLLAASPAGGDGGSPGSGGLTMGGTGGTGGNPTGGTTATGGSGPTGSERSCTSDDDCLQCVYASAPSNPDQCERALGCCGGPVVNRKTCATNEAAWQANCSNRGYTPPICPCIIPCPGSSPPTCRNGQCGYYCR